MNKASKIYVAGHAGMVGSALVRLLHQQGYTNIVTRSFLELDLRRQHVVEEFFKTERPEYVFLTAAKVGGILANSTYKADFIYDNLAIASNVIHASYVYGVKKLINFGSSCIYPKQALQPIKEEYLLTGTLEPTNEPYALAKIAAIKLCRYYHEQYQCDFISLMPTNLYGPFDNFDLQSSHVIPALIRKFHEAKVLGTHEIVVWGTGSPLREFLHVDDVGMAAVFLAQNYSYDDIGECINIGTGQDLSIKDVALLIQKIVGYEGKITFDASKPDGTPRKLLDVTRAKSLGWQSKINLEDGLVSTYAWYQQNCIAKSIIHSTENSQHAL